MELYKTDNGDHKIIDILQYCTCEHECKSINIAHNLKAVGYINFICLL